MMGNDQNLDETVLAFKHFINRYPHLIAEIRKNGRSWQEYYEKWILLGEDDPFWNQFKQESPTFSKERSSQLFNQFLTMAENIDLNKMQKQVGEINKTFDNVQQTLNQFLESRQKSQKHDHPFHWFRD